MIDSLFRKRNEGEMPGTFTPSFPIAHPHRRVNYR